MHSGKWLRILCGLMILYLGVAPLLSKAGISVFQIGTIYASNTIGFPAFILIAIGLVLIFWGFMIHNNDNYEIKQRYRGEKIFMFVEGFVAIIAGMSIAGFMMSLDYITYESYTFSLICVAIGLLFIFWHPKKILVR